MVTKLPTSPVFANERRPNRTSPQRRAMKESGSPQMLLSKLENAICKGFVDHSVIGAAMQTCGIEKWWEALLEVRRLQKTHDIKLNPVERKIFLTAIVRAVNGSMKGIVPER